MNDILKLISNPYFILAFTLFSVVVAIFRKQLLEVFEALLKGVLKYKERNDNKELLLKFDEQIKLTKQLINGNKKMQLQFEELLKKAVTYKEVEHIIYNLNRFLELKQ